MNCSVLKAYFEGNCDSLTLVKDVEGTVTQTALDTFTYRIEDDLSDSFTVKPEHLLKLCDAFLAGDVTAQSVEDIAFGLIAAENFDWDSEAEQGARVADVLHNWDSPEINYPITITTMEKFRRYLLTGENTFARDDLSTDAPQRPNRGCNRPT
jgi:hypothetical protein